MNRGHPIKGNGDTTSAVRGLLRKVKDRNTEGQLYGNGSVIVSTLS
jgi:hypothetical protein